MVLNKDLCCKFLFILASFDTQMVHNLSLYIPLSFCKQPLALPFIPPTTPYWSLPDETLATCTVDALEGKELVLNI